MPRFIAYDRIIDSAIALPGAMLAAAEDSVDWHVAIDRCSAPPFDTGLVWEKQQLSWTINPTEQYLCEARRLIVRATIVADQQQIERNAIANGLPALAWIAGDIVLHACAVIMPGADVAIAFMAPSRGGKSTMLAQLMAKGATLLADDTLVLRHDGTRWIGSGLPMGWFERDPEAGESVRRFVGAKSGQSARRAEIAAIMVLQLVDAGSSTVMTPVTGTEAIAALLAHRHRPQVPVALGCTVPNLQQMAAIAASVPVFKVRRTRGDPALTTAELQSFSAAACFTGL